jgi:Uma2 family endonuclease
MNAVPTVELMTADEYLALEPPQTARRLELVEGEVVVHEPTWMHGDSQGRIHFALEHWTRAAAGRGRAHVPIDVKLDDRNVYAPDVVWYRQGRAPAHRDPPPYPPPDLAVEVRSPSTWRYDIGAKKRNYERHGVAELWLVDTAADVVLVFGRSSPQTPTYDLSEELDAESTLTSPLLPGFALPVAEIFGD